MTGLRRCMQIVGFVVLGLSDLIDPHAGLSTLSYHLDVDRGPFPLDKPLPDVDVPGVQGHYQEVREATARDGLTLRDLGKPFVSDTRSSIGGPGEALQAGELLLSALASCGLGLIQKHARNQGIELGEVEISATFKRHAEDPTRYEYIKLAVAFGHGISADTGDACIAHFTENCPIYNTLRRGGPISIERL